jgi:hypothetical protein
VRTTHGILDVLSAKPSDSIDFIKVKLSQKTCLPTEDMTFFFVGTILDPCTLSLSAIGVVDQSVVYVLWDVRLYEHLSDSVIQMMIITLCSFIQKKLSGM